MLLEIAIGDAYGRSFEFNTREFIEQNNFPERGYAHREGEAPTGTGTYTDDTQMSIAVAMHMLSKKPVATAAHYAHRFLAAYKRDPHAGYSRRVRTALESSNNVVEFLENVRAKGANSNGSVMRTIPLGLMRDPQDVIHHCIAHTTATHCSVDAINATIAVALCAHYFIYYPDIQHRKQHFEHMLSTKWMDHDTAFRILKCYLDTPDTGVPCDAKLTASWAIKLAWETSSYAELLKASVALGGDVDSIAALGMGLLSLNNPTDSVPSILLNNLENGQFGRDYLVKLDGELFKAYKTEEQIA